MNTKQRTFCEIIIKQAKSWNESNDINSPEHWRDISQTINSPLCLCFNHAEKEEIETTLIELLQISRRI